MRKVATATFSVIGAAGVLALGVAVAALAATSSSSTRQATSEETTEETTEATTTTKYSVGLSAAAEVPKPTGVQANATGAFALTLTHKGSTYSITWTLTYRNLTGRVTAAHLHRGKPGKAGPVLVTLCGPCTSGRKGARSVSSTVASAITGGLAYVNLHTAKNKGGEIRAQVRARS
jgi:hypothetical protein